MLVYCNYHNLEGLCTEEDYKDAEFGRNPSRMVRVHFKEFTQAVPFTTLEPMMEAVHPSTGKTMTISAKYLNYEPYYHNPEEKVMVFGCDEGTFIGHIKGKLIMFDSWRD